MDISNLVEVHASSAHDACRLAPFVQTACLFGTEQIAVFLRIASVKIVPGLSRLL